MEVSIVYPGGSVNKAPRVAVVWIRKAGWPVTKLFHEYGSAIKYPDCNGMLSLFAKTEQAIRVKCLVIYKLKTYTTLTLRNAGEVGIVFGLGNFFRYDVYTLFIPFG